MGNGTGSSTRTAYCGGCRGKALIPVARVLPSGIELNIRQARLSDAPAIVNANLCLARETENRQLDAGRVASGVQALLREPARGAYFVAESGGTFAGQLLVTYEWSDWRNGNLWWLQSVYVHPDFRRQGVFRRLFHYLQTLAAVQPEVAGLRLYMHSENRTARCAYEGLGMSRTQYEVFELDLQTLR